MEKSRQSFDKSRKSQDLEKPLPLPSGSKETWPGHYNRLDQTQQNTLTKFKAVLQEKGLYTPDPPSHDEPTLMYVISNAPRPTTNLHSRYLRARRWDINGALAQFAETIKARKDNRVDELYENVDVGFYEKARVLV